MDWSRIKTIFIITFLLLNIFLGYEVLLKINENQLEVLVEASIEEKLDADEIKYVELPKESIKEGYISAQSRVFSEQEVSLLKNQKAVLTNLTTIHSVIKEPLFIPEKNKQFFFTQFLKEYVIDGEQYQYWKTDPQTQTIYFFQKYKGKMIYYNNNAMLTLHYGSDNKLVSYEQTMLKEIAEMESTIGNQELIPAIKALEILYEKNELPSKSKITKVELGYYKLIPEETDIQVIAPAWHFSVNGDKDLFINAIEGQIIRSETKDGVRKNELAF
ncbi:MAG: two-component system regulatory protein YycI [Bacillaceae bacterium]